MALLRPQLAAAVAERPWVHMAAEADHQRVRHIGVHLQEHHMQALVHLL
jgi:hypothetical protein